jgi:hypothetical protein
MAVLWRTLEHLSMTTGATTTTTALAIPKGMVGELVIAGIAIAGMAMDTAMVTVSTTVSRRSL